MWFAEMTLKSWVLNWKLQKIRPQKITEMKSKEIFKNLNCEWPAQRIKQHYIIGPSQPSAEEEEKTEKIEKFKEDHDKFFHVCHWARFEGQMLDLSFVNKNIIWYGSCAYLVNQQGFSTGL